VYEYEMSRDRREDPSLQHYLTTIGRYKLLTREQEFELARRIRQGDLPALDELVNANLRFVVCVAKKFLNRGLSYMDLIAEGNIGLITAARRFDERRDFRFISYAVWWIRQSIQKAIADKTNTVRLPVNRMQQAQKMRRVTQALEQTNGRRVDDEELGAALRLAPRKLRQIRAATRPLLSFDDAPFDEDHPLSDTLTDGDLLNPEEAFVEHELAGELAAAMQQLGNRERGIVARYYGLDGGEPVSLEEIGLDMGLSRERVRQIRNHALSVLRQAVVQRNLRDFLA